MGRIRRLDLAAADDPHTPIPFALDILYDAKGRRRQLTYGAAGDRPTLIATRPARANPARREV